MLFLIEILSSFWKSCLKVSRLGQCTRSELHQVLWTSLIILQLVLAPGDHQNPSFLAIFFLPHLLVVLCHFSMSSEAFFMILRYSAIYWNWAAKLALSASDICSLKAKLKIWPTQCLRGWLGLSSDGSCWCWFFVVVVSAWSQSISILAFPWFPKFLGPALKSCSSIFSDERSELEIRRTLVHARWQQLSSCMGVHAWRSTASAPTRTQCSPTFSIRFLTFCLGYEFVISVVDFSNAVVDLKNGPTLVHGGSLALSRPVVASSWPSLPTPSTSPQWPSEFLHFGNILCLWNQAPNCNHNISTHRNELKNRPTLVDAARWGLSTPVPCIDCYPAPAERSWKHLANAHLCLLPNHF